jgi:LPXTG-site transpeptidase (sortase) family protein
MPADPIEQALGFALPSGSVNSVTQVGVATRLVIPKLSLDAPVVLAPIKDQTWQVDHLGQAVGHLEGTAPPGSESNIVLAGHITLAAEVYGPFAGLGQLISGDEIIVYEGDRPSKYVVDDFQTVERTAVEVTYPSNTGQITLITCQNWDDATGRYLQRLIVKGHLVKS